MKLATIIDNGRTAAVRIDSDAATELGVASVGALLADPGWQATAAAAAGTQHALKDLRYAPVVPQPPKIICVGLNYRSHIAENNLEVPAFPTLFAKYTSSLIGAHDDIVLPPESDQVDWEAELAVIIGRRARRVSVEQAADVIGGFAILNDVSVRDWQRRTGQWLQGKTFEATTPLGPWLVTPDEAPFPHPSITCEVDGKVMQQGETGDLVFDPQTIISYVSTIVTLEPGDVIATGTPAGVGAAQKPPRFLRPGQTVVTRITGLGELRNTCRLGVD